MTRGAERSAARERCGWLMDAGVWNEEGGSAGWVRGMPRS